jgi:cobalt-zinc-cadmium efflux system outer membrane protein
MLSLFAIAIIAQLACNAQEHGASTMPRLLSMPAAMEIMLRNNPLMLREEQNLPIAQSALAEAGKRPNPEVEIGSESYPAFEASPGSFLNNQELSLRAGEIIETAGKRKKRMSVAKQDVAIAGTSVNEVVRQLKLELKRRYYDVVLAKAQAELAQQMLDQFDQIVRVTEARYKQGDISGLEMSRTRAERARFFGDLVDANLQLTNSKLSLVEILGVPDFSASFEIEDKLTFEDKAIDIDQLRRLASDTRPDLVAARLGAERNSRRLDLEHANAIPNVTTTFGYKRDFGVDAPVFALSLPLPVFNRNQAGVARARAELEQQQQEVDRISLAVARQVQQAYQTVSANAAKVEALEKEYVPSAKRSLEIAQESYRLGSLDLISLLDSERTYRETLRSYNQALYDHSVASFELEAAVGKEF